MRSDIMIYRKSSPSEPKIEKDYSLTNSKKYKWGKIIFI